MTYEEFQEHLRTKCMYETEYTDSDGRDILVIRMLDAYVMMRRLVEAEREACAKLCDIVDDGREDLSAECAAVIRARGEKK